jgi:hypothetical protein
MFVILTRLGISNGFSVQHFKNPSMACPIQILDWNNLEIQSKLGIRNDGAGIRTPGVSVSIERILETSLEKAFGSWESLSTGQ